MASAHQKRFGGASKRCFAKGPKSAKEFGRCMRAELKGSGKAKRSSKRKSRKSRRKSRR